MSLSDMEKLIRAANRIARALEKANDLQETINERFMSRLDEDDEEDRLAAEEDMLARYDAEIENYDD